MDLLIIDAPRRSLNSVAFEQTDQYTRLELKTRDIIDLICEGRRCFDTAFDNQARKIEQLHLQAQGLNAEQHARNSADIANLHACGSSPTPNFIITTEDYKDVHRSLAYSTIHHRHDNIAEAHKITCEWIF